jgi:hypothetical protein
MLNLISWFKFIRNSLVTSISFLFHSSSGSASSSSCACKIHFSLLIEKYVFQKMKLWNTYDITLKLNEIIPSVTLGTLIIACFYCVSFITFMISYHFHIFPLLFWNFHNFSCLPLIHPFWSAFLTWLNNY